MTNKQARKLRRLIEAYAEAYCWQHCEHTYSVKGMTVQDYCTQVKKKLNGFIRELTPPKPGPRLGIWDEKIAEYRENRW